MEIYNLDLELPEDDSISITINKITYVIPMVISYGLGCYLLTQKDTLAEIFNSGTGKPSLSIKTLDFAYKVALELIKEQNPEVITDAYLKKHLSTTKLIVMLIKMIKPFLTFMTGHGASLIGTIEQKKGEVTDDSEKK